LSRVCNITLCVWFTDHEETNCKFVYYVFSLQLVLTDLVLEAQFLVSQAHQAAANTDDEDRDEETRMYTEDSTSLTIPSVHFAFTVISGRLNLFAQLVQALPDSVKTMVEHGKSLEMVCLHVLLLLTSLYK